MNDFWRGVLTGASLSTLGVLVAVWFVLVLGGAPA